MRGSRYLFLFVLLLTAFKAEAGLITIFNYNPPPPPPFQIISSSPGANVQLADTPQSVSVVFSQNVVADKNALKLYDQYNRPVNTVVSVNQSATNVLKIEIPGKLFSGTYRVDVNASCLCTGSPPVTSSFYFTIY